MGRGVYVLAAGLLLCLMLSACCAPCYDSTTVANLNTMMGMDRAVADSCDAFVTYEAGKKDGDGPYDKKSERHVREACDCLKETVDKPEVVKQSCEATIKAYLAYEANKKD